MEQIKQEEEGSKGTFYMGEPRNKLAEMTYSKAGDSMIIIDHTEVSDALRGTGSGKALVFQAVEFARLNNIKILPLCPFAKSVFDKNPDIRDVLS